MAENESISSILKLVEFSKEIRLATAEKEKYMELLQQLNFFVNFSELFRENESAVEVIFKLSSKVVASEKSSDMLIVSIENYSESFIFNSAYWSFVLQEDGTSGRSECSTWKLGRPFKPKDMEYVSVPISSTKCSSVPLKYKISLVFDLHFNDSYFQRLFPCGEIGIDALYFLSPGRRLDILLPPSFSVLDSSKVDTTFQTTHLVTKFEFQADENLQKEFLKLFFRDSAHRGFSPDLLKHSELTNDIRVYLESEEVRVILRVDRIIIRTKPPILHAIKKCLLKRFSALKGFRLNCLNDAHYEELYKLKLKLESLGVSDSEDEAEKESALQECCLQLRKVTEGLRFHLNPLSSSPQSQQSNNMDQVDGTGTGTAAREGQNGFDQEQVPDLIQID